MNPHYAHTGIKNVVYTLACLLFLSSCATQFGIQKRRYHRGFQVSVSDKERVHAPEANAHVPGPNTAKVTPAIVEEKVLPQPMKVSNIVRADHPGTVLQETANKAFKTSQQRAIEKNTPVTGHYHLKTKLPVAAKQDYPDDVYQNDFLIRILIGIGLSVLLTVLFVAAISLGSGALLVAVAFLFIVLAVLSFLYRVGLIFNQW